MNVRNVASVSPVSPTHKKPIKIRPIWYLVRLGDP